MNIIELAITNLHEKTLETIKTTVNKQCEILLNNDFTSNTLKLASKEQLLQEKFFSLNLPCPLLSIDNSCLIYNIRPSVCWSYRNYGEPSECTLSWTVPHAIKYDDWEIAVVKRLFQARKPSKKNTMNILQFALQGLFTQ